MAGSHIPEAHGDGGTSADTCYTKDRNAVLFERFENVGVRDASGKAAPKASPIRTGATVSPRTESGRRMPVFSHVLVRPDGA